MARSYVRERKGEGNRLEERNYVQIGEISRED